MNRLIQAMAFPILILGLVSTQARADFVFDVTMPSSGTTGTVEFDISSNDSATLSDYNLSLNIAQTATSTSSAAFSVNQPTQVSGNGLPYVFAGVSEFGSLLWGPPFLGPANNIIGGDSAVDPVSGLPTSVTVSTAAYLGTVQYEVPVGADTGQTFQITLFGAGAANPSEFDDQNGNPLSYTASFTASAGGGGTVTIDISTASVPEPSSLSMAAIASLGGLLVYRRSRR